MSRRWNFRCSSSASTRVLRAGSSPLEKAGREEHEEGTKSTKERRVEGKPALAKALKKLKRTLARTPRKAKPKEGRKGQVAGAGRARRCLLASRGSIGLAGRASFKGALVRLGLITVVGQPECLPEAQQMPMDAERPSPDPRSTTHHQTTPRPADSFVRRAPDELAIWRSWGWWVAHQHPASPDARSLLLA